MKELEQENIKLQTQIKEIEEEEKFFETALYYRDENYKKIVDLENELAKIDSACAKLEEISNEYITGNNLLYNDN